MSKKVAIIEDNELNIEVLEGALKAFDVEVHSASDGADGLKMIRSERPDLILLDLQLPGLDGETILSALRADQSWKDVPIIVITAKAMKGEEERVMDLGATLYLPKPVRLKPLREIIAPYLE